MSTKTAAWTIYFLYTKFFLCWSWYRTTQFLHLPVLLPASFHDIPKHLKLPKMVSDQLFPVLPFPFFSSVIQIITYICMDTCVKSTIIHSERSNNCISFSLPSVTYGSSTDYVCKISTLYPSHLSSVFGIAILIPFCISYTEYNT